MTETVVPKPGRREASGRLLEMVKQVVLSPYLPLALAWAAAVAAASSQDPLLGLLAFLGFVGGFASGLVGIGGGLIMIPLLLLVPQSFGLAALDPHLVTGITAVQVVAAALSGLGGHLSAGSFSLPVFVVVGGAMTVASFAGAVISGSVDPAVLKIVFSVLALVAAALLLFAPPPPSTSTEATPTHVRAVGALSGAAVGFPAGMVGVGGAFLEIPIMVHLLKVPMRIAVGTALGIVALSASATLLGKFLTGQVDWLLALALVAGALPAGRLGSAVSRRAPVRSLSVVLGLLVGLAGLRLWADVLL